MDTKDDKELVAGNEVAIDIVPHPKLTLFQTCNIVVSSVGGAGVFVAMSTMMHSTGSVGVLLIVILVSGLLNYSLAKCFTEVALLLPKSGGPYFFVLEVFGELPAFLFIWGFVFMIIGPAWAYLAYTAALYIVQLFFIGCNPPSIVIKLIGACILVFVAVINCTHMKYVTKVQTVLTSTKLIASVFIVICGVVYAAKGNIEYYKNIFEGSTDNPGDIAISILSGSFLYGGWQLITFLIEEMESPARNLPKTLSISFTIVIILTELTVAAYFTMVSPQEMKTADAVAILFAERIYKPFGPLIAIFVTATAIAGLNAVILAQSRLASAAAKHKHLPMVLATINEKYNMPWASTVFLTVISLLLLIFGDLARLIITVSFYAVVMGLAVLLCLIALRIKQPNKKRIFSVWIGTAIIQLLINAITLVMSIIKQPSEIGALALFIVCGIPVYVVLIKWKSKPKIIDNIMIKISVIMQKMLLLRY
ncbi:hypothetical protein ACF0H5_005836 [Mactra antiquata]